MRGDGGQNKGKAGLGRDWLLLKGEHLFYSQMKDKENIHLKFSFRFWAGKNGAIYVHSYSC